MREILDSIGIIDRPHLPSAEEDATNFKEWFHFVVLGIADGWDVVFNFGLRGDPFGAGRSMVDVILLAHNSRSGWLGDIDPYEGTAARFDAHQLDVAVARASIAVREGRYVVAAELRDAPLKLAAELTPNAIPMMVWNNTTLGSGYLNWLIVPRLVADGELSVDGQAHQFSQAVSYHDHNWGRWLWGDDFGWDWGFFIGPPAAPPERQYTFVFDRTTDRAGGRADAHTLAVWRGSALLKTFTGRGLRAERRGRFDGRVPRRPAAANLIGRGSVQTVPRQFRVSARADADWIDLTYHVDAALQIAIAKETGLGIVGLDETFGLVSAVGSIDGGEIDFAARGCFEFLA